MNFDAPLNDNNGRPIMGIVVGVDGTPQVAPATLGSVAADALANAPASAGLSMDEKLRAFKLSQCVRTGESKVSAESISLIKKCIAAVQTPIVVGRCFEILDPADLPSAGA